MHTPKEQQQQQHNKTGQHPPGPGDCCGFGSRGRPLSDAAFGSRASRALYAPGPGLAVSDLAWMRPPMEKAGAERVVVLWLTEYTGPGDWDTTLSLGRPAETEHHETMHEQQA